LEKLLAANPVFKEGYVSEVAIAFDAEDQRLERYLR